MNRYSRLWRLFGKSDQRIVFGRMGGKNVRRADEGKRWILLRGGRGWMGWKYFLVVRGNGG